MVVDDDDDDDTNNMSITSYIYFAQSVAFNLNNSLSQLSSQLPVTQEMLLTHVTAPEATISQSEALSPFLTFHQNIPRRCN